MTPERPVTPAEFGALVGISRQAVAELQLRGTLTRGATLGRWIAQYAESLRAQAALRSGDLTDSRRQLDEARAAEVRLRNEERRRTLATVGQIDAAIATSAAALADELERLPAAVAQAWPGATEEQLAMVHAEVGRATALARAAKRLITEEPET